MLTSIVYQTFLQLLCWPYRFVLTKFLIPFLVRREVRRKGAVKFKVITYRTFLRTPVVIKIKEIDEIRREVESIRFVANNTSIPVPRIYDMWREASRGCMVMEQLPGRTLRAFWRKLSDEQKKHIFRQLRPYFEELRRIPQPAPAGRIESLIGVCYDERLSDDPFGPFKNEGEFHDWRISTHDWQAEINANITKLLQKSRKAFRDDHRIVFTHGDLHIQNVLVDLRGSQPEDAHVVALLDWEMAAWMPEYWEPVKMLHGQGDKDWRRMVQELFTGYETEIQTDRELLIASGRPC